MITMRHSSADISARAESVRCPRCGYDLRGVVESWKESCDLWSACSECGYTVEWGAMHRAIQNAPKWNIECANRPWSPLVFARTLFRQIRPRRTWRELRLEHRVRTGRLALYLIALFALAATLWYGLWIAYISWCCYWMSETYPSNLGPIADAWFGYVLTPWSRQSGVTVTNWDGTLITPFPPPRAMMVGWLSLGGDSPLDGWFAADLCYGVLGPLVLVGCWLAALAGTPRWMRDERLLPKHYARIGVYALSFIPLNRLATFLIFAWVYLFEGDGWPDGQTMLIAHSIVFSVVFLLSFPWWYFVCRDYLQLKQPFRVTVAVHLFGFMMPLGAYSVYHSIGVLQAWR